MNTHSGQKTISFQAVITHSLCYILSLVLVVGFCPVSALADDQTGKNTSDFPAISEDNTANGEFVSSQDEAQDNQALGSEDQLSPSNEIRPVFQLKASKSCLQLKQIHLL